ncbi:MAG: hypothetical protein GZ087_07940 [Flavobacterium sp.]|nr:hypothetical protein [Flavobacterium sp.]
MKKAKDIVGILVVFLLTFCSCTNENVDQVQVLLLKKIVEISVDGSSNVTTLHYNGNKIVNIDKVDKLSKFYYTGDLITKITELDNTTQHINTLDYSYLEGQLVKITSSDNYVINYIHNKDNSVSYEKLTKDSNNLDVKIDHGILYFQNENLIKDDKTLDNAGEGILAKNTINLEYDTKNNALKNILGFTKLLNYSTAISSNNEITRIENSSIKYIAEDQIISDAKRIDSKYQYNSDSYPTEIVSQNILFGNAVSTHLKSQLFYN